MKQRVGKFGTALFLSLMMACRVAAQDHFPSDCTNWAGPETAQLRAFDLAFPQQGQRAETPGGTPYYGSFADQYTDEGGCGVDVYETPLSRLGSVEFTTPPFVPYEPSSSALDTFQGWP
ncbi:hypothetical protein [Hyphomonas johnsonii]|uniref:Lipoprotein n=1 Tax=Hyphomonas johnsonii MHS-2 TaxID=1280950 RepID=A0A059FSA8_9PROT|nr:hypothetical protein [Hyphomonas johnsonii]KCZ93411.1 hypothetical protein HJO_06130 [Hyphomonas johnsonii MHS-2]